MIILVAGIIFPSCCKDEGTDEPTNEYNRKEMLSNYANNLIVPHYNDLESKVQSLQESATSFTNAPDSIKLNALRTSWKETIKSWQLVSVYELGPASDLLLRDNVNLFPVDTGTVNANISNGGYDLESVGNYDAKGLEALDYLINGLANSDNLIVEKYSTDAQATKRITYLLDVIANLKTKIDATSSDWTAFYADTFSNRLSTDVGSSTGILVNAINKYWEVYLRDGKIGIPAGARSFSGEALPNKVEAYYYNDFSVELCLDAVQNLKNLYLGIGTTGTDGEGLDDYLIFEDAKSASGGQLNTEIRAQFDVVLSKLNSLNEPLSNEVSVNQSAVIEVFDEMQKLAVLLKVDMPAAFGTLITYADNDGD